MDSERTVGPRRTWEAGTHEVQAGVRDALLDAVVAEVADIGYEAAGISGICRRAAVEPAAFLEQFADKQACFLAAARSFVEALFDQVLAALRDTRDIEEGTQAGLGAFLTYLADHPSAARAFLVEGLAAGRDVLAVRDLAMHAFADLIDSLQERAREAVGPGGLVSEATVGGIYGIVTTRVRNGETATLPDLLASLSYFLLAPVVGVPASP